MPGSGACVSNRCGHGPSRVCNENTTASRSGSMAGIGHLCEALAEEVVQRPRTLRQHRQGRVITHGPHCILAGRRHRLQDHVQVFFGIAKPALLFGNHVLRRGLGDRDRLPAAGPPATSSTSCLRRTDPAVPRCAATVPVAGRRRASAPGQAVRFRPRAQDPGPQAPPRSPQRRARHRSSRSVKAAARCGPTPRRQWCRRQNASAAGPSQGCATSAW